MTLIRWIIHFAGMLLGLALCILAASMPGTPSALYVFRLITAFVGVFAIIYMMLKLEEE